MSKKVVTRFPPSPTGLFHVGSVRTALFNYLYARHFGENGKFILRIEDTDTARSKKEYEENLIEGMKWLGLEWDEFDRQSDRTAIYKEYLEKLVAQGTAYISKEEVKKEGDRAEVIRLKNPGKVVTFHDEIRGDISFDTTELGDFVIAKSVTEPLYHFTVVLDDFLMGVTHVIRGEDHISNTPRQILIQVALGAPLPIYAHLPLILDAQRAKLSKRKHGEKVSLDHYVKEGFLKESIINYMALLGWNPNQGDREVFSLKELIELFDLSKIQKSGAIFNEEKLRWFNREYLQKLPANTLAGEFKKILAEKYPAESVEKILPKIQPLILERAATFGDIRAMISSGELDFFFIKPSYILEKMSWKGAPAEKTKAHLEKITQLVRALDPAHFDAEAVKASVWPYAEEVGRGDVLWPFRYALSGREKSPDPFIVAGVLGKEETIARLSAAIAVL